MRLRNTQSIILFALSSTQRRLSTGTNKNRDSGKYLLKDLRMSSCSSSTPKCEPCAGLDESALMSIDEAKTELSSLGSTSSLWSINESKEGVLTLSRKFTARNFQAALDVINDIGAIAENENHHPDLHLTNYREVEVEIHTHKVKGLTGNDFILAGKIDSEVKINYSPKWLRENPTAVPTSKCTKESS